jgi:hypothetical protein
VESSCEKKITATKKEVLDLAKSQLKKDKTPQKEAVKPFNFGITLHAT